MDHTQRCQRERIHRPSPSHDRTQIPTLRPTRLLEKELLLQTTKMTISNTEKVMRLRGFRVAVGHCVCLNDAEQPGGRQLAVITSIEGRGLLRKVFCKYLGSEKQLTNFNKLNDDKGMRVIFVEELTPIEKFGVRISAVEENDGIYYWCEKISGAIGRAIELSPEFTSADETTQLTHCAGERDGDCNDARCPQLKNRMSHCPLDADVQTERKQDE